MGQLSSAGMGYFNKEIAGAELFLSRQSGHRQHWRKTEPPRLAGMKQILDLPLPCPFFHIDFERVLILDAAGAIGKNLPLGPLRVAHEFHEAFPLVLFWNHDEDETILAFIHAPRIHVPLP